MKGFKSFDNKQDLARYAANMWLDRLSSSDSKKPFTVALSGGRIPKLFYELVVELGQPSLFKNVHFFWSDERLVPATDDESNFKLADEGLLRPLRIPNNQVHRVLTEHDEAKAVQGVTDQLQRFTENKEDGQPVIDLVFLGMGEDAHVASLFPGDLDALESKAIYRAVTGPKPPFRRVTLGYPVLSAAREVWVLASGESKVEALRSSISIDSVTPLACVLQSREETKILTDFTL